MIYCRGFFKGYKYIARWRDTDRLSRVLSAVASVPVGLECATLLTHECVLIDQSESSWNPNFCLFNGVFNMYHNWLLVQSLAPLPFLEMGGRAESSKLLIVVWSLW